MLNSVLLAVLLLACLGSFTWAMRSFFVKPERMTTGLRVTLLAGFVFAFTHFFVIFHTQHFQPLAFAFGVLLYLLSLAIFWWTIASHRSKPLAACFSEDEQLHLVQHGPYRFVRHPFYCSYLLAWLAGGVATLSVFLFLTFVAMFILYLVAAVSEEKKFATSSLANQYADYCCATGRFFPKPWKTMTSRRPH
jgi:protein-S-isoprenylcysteine O-methyltransferase Ste14